MPSNTEKFLRADIRDAVMNRDADHNLMQKRLQVILAEETLRLYSNDQDLAVNLSNIEFWKTSGLFIKGFLILALSIPMLQIILTNGGVFMNGFQSIFPVLVTIALIFLGMAVVERWEKENGFWKLENISDSMFKPRFSWTYHTPQTS